MADFTWKSFPDDTYQTEHEYVNALLETLAAVESGEIKATHLLDPEAMKADPCAAPVVTAGPWRIYLTLDGCRLWTATHVDGTRLRGEDYAELRERRPGNLAAWWIGAKA